MFGASNGSSGWRIAIPGAPRSRSHPTQLRSGFGGRRAARRTRRGSASNERPVGIARMRACTIIARNYLAHARVLAASFLEHHPDSTFSVLVIDAEDQPERAEGAEMLGLREIGFDEAE